MKHIPIAERLLSAADMVRSGARVADIGTDHGYLPIYLLSKDRISYAFLSDINEGPLDTARRNLIAYGVSDRASCILSDGASALCGKGITDVCICGMGGELIADMIAKAPWLRDSGIRLILQPMTKHELLRPFLWDNGFSIIKEAYPKEGKKVYMLMQVEYVGGQIPYTDFDAYCGKSECEMAPERALYLEGRRRSLLTAVRGKAKGGSSADREEQILSLIGNALC